MSVAPNGYCPRCCEEVYDLETKRMVVGRKRGVRVGLGAGSGTVGVEVRGRCVIL